MVLAVLPSLKYHGVGRVENFPHLYFFVHEDDYSNTITLTTQYSQLELVRLWVADNPQQPFRISIEGGAVIPDVKFVKFDDPGYQSKPLEILCVRKK